jgi:putative zinc finger/helix-turn-helix YgiT family protein
MKVACPICDVGKVSRVVYTHSLKAGRRTVLVDGCLKMVCEHCGEESISLEMHDHNAKLIEAALAATPAAVSRGLLKLLRETFELSQRDASKMFGAGDAAFAKWESGQTEMSEPAALLVQCALHVPGVMELLATLAGVAIAPEGQRRAARRREGYQQALRASATMAAEPLQVAGALEASGTITASEPAWSNGFVPADDMKFVA